MNERDTPAMTCRCDGYHHPHRRGSLRCNYQPDGEWKTHEQFQALWLQDEEPCYEFE